jgi:hypothetical protein
VAELDKMKTAVTIHAATGIFQPATGGDGRARAAAV